MTHTERIAAAWGLGLGLLAVIGFAYDRWVLVISWWPWVGDCIEKGWYDKPVDFPSAIALLHSEVAEAFEAWRDRGLEQWSVSKSVGIGEDAVHYPAKPEGVASEFADLFIRLLDYCSRFDIRLIEAVEQKMTYNTTRPYRHGGKAV